MDSTVKRIIILGSARSGTSLTGSILHELGVHILKPDFVDEFNPQGYWGEDPELLKLNQAIRTSLGERVERNGPGESLGELFVPKQWDFNSNLAQLRPTAIALRSSYDTHGLWAWKDVNMSLTLPLWKEIIPSAYYLVCVRNPLAVARSEVRRYGYSLTRALASWQVYTTAALKNVEGEKFLTVFYDDLLDRPSSIIEQIAAFLGLSVSPKAVDVVSRDLKLREPSTEDLISEESVPLSVKLFYLMLLQTKGNAPLLLELQKSISKSVSTEQQFMHDAQVDKLSAELRDADKELARTRSRLDRLLASRVVRLGLAGKRASRRLRGVSK